MAHSHEVRAFELTEPGSSCSGRSRSEPGSEARGRAGSEPREPGTTQRRDLGAAALRRRRDARGRWPRWPTSGGSARSTWPGKYTHRGDRPARAARSWPAASRSWPSRPSSGASPSRSARSSVTCPTPSGSSSAWTCARSAERWRASPVGRRRSVLDALPMAVVVVDAGSRISGWNPAAEVLYGYSGSRGRRRRRASSCSSTRTTAARPSSCFEGGRRGRRGRATAGCAGVTARCWSARSALVPVGDAGALGLGRHRRHRPGPGRAGAVGAAERRARRPGRRPRRPWRWSRPSSASAPVGIAVFDLDLRYVRVNDAYAAAERRARRRRTSGGRIGEVVAAAGRVGGRPAPGAHHRPTRSSGRHHRVA